MNVKEEIGMELSESLVMIPASSVSGCKLVRMIDKMHK